MSFGNIGIGRKTVTNHGTAVQLTTSHINVKRVVITALKSNTNLIAIGGSTVLAALGSEVGVLLKATDQPFELFHEDLSKIYIDSITDGEGVAYFYEY